MGIIIIIIGLIGIIVLILLLNYFSSNEDNPFIKFALDVSKREIEFGKIRKIDSNSDSTEINSLLCTEIKWILHSLQDVHTPLNPARFL